MKLDVILCSCRGETLDPLLSYQQQLDWDVSLVEM